MKTFTPDEAVKVVEVGLKEICYTFGISVYKVKYYLFLDVFVKRMPETISMHACCYIMNISDDCTKKSFVGDNVKQTFFVYRATAEAGEAALREFLVSEELIKLVENARVEAQKLI